MSILRAFSRQTDIFLALAPAANRLLLYTAGHPRGPAAALRGNGEALAMTAHATTGALAPETLDRLRRVSTATLTTQLYKRGFKNVFLPGVRRSARASHGGAGRHAALRPGARGSRGLRGPRRPDYPQRHAIEHIEPGQVLVMDCRGVASASGAGDILVARLQARGAAGLVLDGGIRDYASVEAFGFPVYALGPAAPAHVARHLAVDENVPIGCAEVLVLPGDVMVGDGEGVVCVPRAVADRWPLTGSSRRSSRRSCSTR